METLPELLTSHLYLMITPHDSARKTMAEVIARLALRGPLSVMDGGNLFDPYRVARQVRRQTHELDSALERISLRRAFTCYQMAVLLAKAPAGAQPPLAGDVSHPPGASESPGAGGGERLPSEGRAGRADGALEYVAGGHR
jgi:hypothetical protein